MIFSQYLHVDKLVLRWPLESIEAQRRKNIQYKGYWLLVLALNLIRHCAIYGDDRQKQQGLHLLS